MTEDEVATLKKEITALDASFSLIIGDTAASFFPGEDENDNVEAGQYARTLRMLTGGKGNPAVVVLSHPVKNARRDNMLPRGGGAFLNELDGNLALWSDVQGEVTSLHWQGKIRGPDFSPVGFRLRSVRTGFFDKKNRHVMTIVAEPMSDEAAADLAKNTTAREDTVLAALRDHPEWSLGQIATDRGWLDNVGEPQKWIVQRAIVSLADDKLISQQRKGGRWIITEKGEKALDGKL